MGARGPMPTPTKLKVLRGETRPSRLNRTEPKPLANLPRMPLDMGPAAKTVWRSVLREMGATGVILAVDADILRVYCDSVARYLHASTMLEASGPLIRGARNGDLVKNPLTQIVRDNAVLVRSFARELGLTPSARTGLRGNGQDERDPFADFLDGRDA